ncbi:GspE/PulE family protein [Orbus mooreae]|uniref:GspE/PulE family protein n=1 Tax=Orbus mooreae TaxID=3074107 RepID=UPI00370CFFFD
MLNTNIKYHESDVIEQVNQLLNDGLSQRASDIHFEPYEQQLRIRMRIDGVLKTVERLPITLAKPLIVRLKIMAKLNIAEQRLPQDGLLTIGQQTMRVSSIPILHGEKIVLRVMDNHKLVLSIEQLGLTNQEQNQYRKILNSPQGLILVTGPTGSGKTITLYSGLKEINNDTRNICSVEDPIEMPIDGINQTQINTKAGLGFSSILRSFLRQDPDIMMIGEIRDNETAEIAMQAAQTGHLVLSTLHTNSSAEALIRLNQIGIKNYLIASSLKLIIAQRLVRKLCNHCKMIADVKHNAQHYVISPNSCHFIAQGCSQCSNGYSGRIGVYEFLLVNQQLQALLLSNSECSLNQIEQIIQQNNIKTLSSSGKELVTQGITSIAEVQRVLGD